MEGESAVLGSFHYITCTIGLSFDLGFCPRGRGIVGEMVELHGGGPRADNVCGDFTGSQPW